MKSYVMWAYLFIVGQGFFLSLLLFTRKGTAHRIFSAFIFVFTYEIFIQYLLRSYGRNCFPVIFHLRDALMFLYGPLVYLYFSVSVGAIKALKPGHLLHLIPALTFSYLKFLALNDKLALFGPILSPDEAAGIVSFNGIYHIMVFSFAALYLAQSVRLLMGYRRRSEGRSDAETEIHKRWLSILAIYSISTIVLFGAGLVCYLGILPYASAAFHMLSMWFSVSIIFSGYMVIRHVEIYRIMHGIRDTQPVVIDSEMPECSGEKYAKTRLSDETRDAYLETINDLLNREQLFLDPEITLSMFSDRVGIPAHHVSQVINVKMSHNFFSLMNSRRVEYAKDLLLLPESASKTVLDIAYESGFNSKTTFNTVFKEQTGCTPSEYKRKMRGVALVNEGKCLVGAMQSM